MFFTREDILKIQAELTKLGVKDSDFRDAHTPLDSNDILVLSQGGRNVKIRIQDFLEQLHLLSSDDFINVTTKFDAHHLSLQEAIQILPSKVRKIGLTITFQNIEGNWEIWQFTSNNIHQFNEPSAWENCKVSVDSIAIPDEEDLTMITQGTRLVTKFKDKTYDPASFSGKGRVYLRKNVTKVQDPNTKETKTVNLLTLKMLGKENTIYVIQYDYDLNGLTITVPAGCVLDFLGGSFCRGTLKGSNTIVNGSTNCLDCTLDGIFHELYLSWIKEKTNINISRTSNLIIDCDETITVVGTARLSSLYSIEGNNHILNIYVNQDSIGSQDIIFNLMAGVDVLVRNLSITCNYTFDESHRLYFIFGSANCGRVTYDNLYFKTNFVCYKYLSGQVLDAHDKTGDFIFNNCRFEDNNGVTDFFLEILPNWKTKTEEVTTNTIYINSCSFSGAAHYVGFLSILGLVGDLRVHNCIFNNDVSRRLQYSVTVCYNEMQVNFLEYRNCTFYNYGTQSVDTPIYNNKTAIISNCKYIVSKDCTGFARHVGYKNVYIDSCIFEIYGMTRVEGVDNLYITNCIFVNYHDDREDYELYINPRVLTLTNNSNITIKDCIFSLVNTRKYLLLVESVNNITYEGNLVVNNFKFELDSKIIDPANLISTYGGSTFERPKLSESLSAGLQYFDTTLNKPIWWTGSKWVDSTGADV